MMAKLGDNIIEWWHRDFGINFIKGLTSAPFIGIIDI